MNKAKPSLVSVVMSIYNERIEWITKAIDSILNQTYTNFELIIVNDNIKNKTNSELLHTFQNKDERIRIINNSQNYGLAKSMNIAIKVSKGSYIARMDADDISTPNRLAKQVAYLEQHPDISVLGTQIKKFGSKNNIKIFPSKPYDLKTKLFFKCCISHPSVMIKRSVIEEKGYYYNEDYKSAQDYDLWTRMMLNENIANLNEVLLYYRIHNKQTTNIKREEQLMNTIVSHHLMLTKSSLIDDIDTSISIAIWRKMKFKGLSEYQYFYDMVFELMQKNNRLKVFDPYEFNKSLCKILFRRKTKIQRRDLKLCKLVMTQINLFSSFKKQLNKIYVRGKVVSIFYFSSPLK